jgi:hypothetical protein
MALINAVTFSSFNPGGNSQVGDVLVGLRNTTNYQMTFPGTGINDVAGNLMLGWSAPSGTCVNALQIRSAITVTNPGIGVVGTDTNIGIDVTTKGTGTFNILGTGVMTIPYGGTLQRPTGVAGAIRINSDAGVIEFWNNVESNWESVEGSGGIPSTTTANQVLLSTNDSSPVWSTSTYPSTNAINTLLYASATNTMAALATANYGVLVTSSIGVPSISTTPYLNQPTAQSLEFTTTTGILDSKANPLLSFYFATTPVNYLILGNAATTTTPYLQAAGSDTNIGLTLYSKGSGPIIFYSPTGLVEVTSSLGFSTTSGPVTLGNGNNLIFANTGNTKAISINANSCSQSTTYVLPPTPPSVQSLLSSTSGGTMSWVPNSSVAITYSVVTTGATLAPGNGYFSNGSGTLTFTLPALANVGDNYEVAAIASGWTVAQLTGQKIQIGNINTTLSSGSISSTGTGDWIKIVCYVANTNFIAHIQQGNVSVV